MAVAHATARRTAGWHGIAATSTADDWPHTVRPLPWIVAGFLAMVLLVPFDVVTLSGVSAPVDLKLDRLFLGCAGFAWLLALMVGGAAAPRFRRSPVAWALAAFVAVAVAGVAVNAPVLAQLGELELAVKKLALLFSLAGVFVLVATVVRPSEVPAFVRLLVILACAMALGVIWEYRTGSNLFYDWADALLRGPFDVPPEHADPEFGRPLITGPTQHAIAAATALGMALPFAVAGMLRNGRGRAGLLYALASGTIVAGAFATQRKTGLIVPAAALLVLVAYRPREMVGLLPVGLVLIALLQVVTPGAVVGVKAQFVGPNLTSDSTTGRTDDYAATRPDVFRYPVLGRGHGTYEPPRYRFLDNEYLHRLIETGVLGLAAYLALVATVAATAERARRRAPPRRRLLAIAAVSATAAFAVASAIFDAISFPQPIYLLFAIAGLMTALAAGERRPPKLPTRLRGRRRQAHRLATEGSA